MSLRGLPTASSLFNLQPLILGHTSCRKGYLGMGCQELLADCVRKISHLWLFDGHSPIITSVKKRRKTGLSEDVTVRCSQAEEENSSTVDLMRIQPAGFCTAPRGGGWPVPFVIKKFAWSEKLPPGAGHACPSPFLFRPSHSSGLLSVSCKEIEWETSVNGASVLTSSQLSSEV